MFTEEDKIISRIAYESRVFVFDNFKVLIKIFLPLLPFIVICLAGNYQMMKHYAGGVNVFDLLINVFYGVFALSWHKFVMHGADSDYKTSIFALKKNDFKFLGVLILLSLPIPVLSFFVESFEGWEWISLQMLVIALITWFSLRVSLYFPAAAYGQPMDLRGAFKEGIGLPMRLIVSNILALWRIYFIFTLIVALPIVGFEVMGVEEGAYFYGYLTAIASFILSSITTAIAVTVLSKYYLAWRKDLGLEVL